MNKKNITFFFNIGGKKGSFKEYHISESLFRYGCLSFIIVTLFLLVVSVDYFFSFSDRSQYNKYQAENTELKSQLAHIYNKMQQVDSRLYQIEDFSHKIKEIAGITQKNIYSIGSIGPLENSSVSSLMPTMSATTAPPTTTKNIFDIASLSDVDQVVIYMDNLDKKSRLVHQDTTKLVEQIYEKQDALNYMPTLWPAKGWLSSKFGYRKYPFTGEVTLHEGIDIAAYPGTPVYAPSYGVVIFAGYKSSYGKVIIIDHGYDLTTLYGHLSDIMVVQWQKLKRGQVIGTIGNTGNSSGPHLHYEIRISNVPVDPYNYIVDTL